MSETVTEWIAKAEGDFQIAAMLMRARKHRNPDGVCFHVQQCVEKLMKAVLIRRKVTPPRTHDLVRLGGLVGKAVVGWNWDRQELKSLNAGAVIIRYPGTFATEERAKSAMKLCRKLRARPLMLV
jgi:HEPN domain-containing protein